MNARELLDFVENKTLEELEPKSDLPIHRAPYAFKILLEKIRINEEIQNLKDELDALSRL